jgi:3-oxoacyl-[acyl-carrier protein] reductase
MNLKSVFLCSQAVLPAMLKQRYGKIVNISSIYGFSGNATRSVMLRLKPALPHLPNRWRSSTFKTASTSTPLRRGRIETPRVRGHYSDEAWAAEVGKIPMGPPGHNRGDRQYRALPRSR